jgi:hypothetical protein
MNHVLKAMIVGTTYEGENATPPASDRIWEPEDVPVDHSMPVMKEKTNGA